MATDDGFYDILERDPETDVWTTTFQTTECMRAGHATASSSAAARTRARAPTDYRLESDTFKLAPITNLTPTLAVNGLTARVTALYPDPGEEDTILALPRRVRSGWAVLGVKRKGRKQEKRVRARLTKDRLAFQARVPRGAKVRVIRVSDGCGNRSARGA